MPSHFDLYQPTQPLVSQFFSTAFETQRLSHGYVFMGQNTDEMYRLALDVAKLLNCENKPSPQEVCNQCRNCHWISDNAHPAVITVSRLTYEDMAPEKSKNSAHTTISVGQISQLITQMSLSTAHHRVVIFCDVAEVASDEECAPNTLPITPPYDWRGNPKNDNKTLLIRPLTRKVFDPRAANRFLKTLEEPVPNTLFIFITDTEENLLETIISRCQLVRFKNHIAPFATSQELPQEQVQVFAKWLEPLQGDPYDIKGLFDTVLIKEAKLTHTQALERFQVYLAQRFQQKFNGQPIPKPAYQAYSKTHRALQEARQMIDAKTHPDQTLLHLLFALHGTRS